MFSIPGVPRRKEELSIISPGWGQFLTAVTVAINWDLLGFFQRWFWHQGFVGLAPTQNSEQEGFIFPAVKWSFKQEILNKISENCPCKMNPPLFPVFFLHRVESKHCLALKHGYYFDRFLFKKCCSGFSLAPLCCLNKVRFWFCKRSEKCLCLPPITWQERSKYQICFCISFFL